MEEASRKPAARLLFTMKYLVVRFKDIKAADLPLQLPLINRTSYYSLKVLLLLLLSLLFFRFK